MTLFVKLLCILSLTTTAFAQTSITMWPRPTSSAPVVSAVGGYPTCTAIVDGSDDKTVTFTTTGGTLVGNALPSQQTNGNQTIALTYSGTVPATFTVTATSHADASKTATCAIKFVAAPVPATTHPHLMTTASALAAFQAKGIPASNTVYSDGIWSLAQTYYNGGTKYYTSKYTTPSTWNGSACVGGSGENSDLSSSYIELWAYYFSLVSLYDNNATTRSAYGCYGHDVAMTVAKYGIAAQGLYVWTGNPWNYSSIDLAFMYDNLLGGNGYFTTDEQSIIRQFMLTAEHTLLTSVANGTTAPLDSTLYNTAGELQASNASSGPLLREFGNNYTHSRNFLVASYALTFSDDTTNDPTIAKGGVVSLYVNPTGGSGGSGWVAGDLFTFAGAGTGGQGKCLTVVSGACSEIVITNMGTNYTTSSNVAATAVGPSVGTGLIVSYLAGNTCGTTRYGLCTDGTAGSLHAYWNYEVGGNLYTDWATVEDPTVVQQAYNTAFSGSMPSAPTCNMNANVTVPCLGINRGGESIEGVDYGFGSISKMSWLMNAIHNAGYDDPVKWGPQVSYPNSSFWDLHILADYSALLALDAISADKAHWSFSTNGDSNHFYAFPTDYEDLVSLAVLDNQVGRTDRLNEIEWIAMNSAYGMADGTVGSCTSYCGFLNELSDDWGSGVANSFFMAYPSGNPVTTNPPTDPRSAFPLYWYGAGNKHVMLRNNWTQGSNTVFNLYASDTEVDHEHQVDGRFEIWSNGEVITKGRNVFDDDYNNWMTTGTYSNLMTIYQSQGSASYDLPYGPATHYGQQWHAQQAGLVPFTYSTNSGYAGFHLDLTNAYNSAASAVPGFADVSAASRDIIYLSGSNQVAWYDRAAVSHAASTQSDQINTSGTVTWTGSVGCWNTRSGTQKACVSQLLPAGATNTATGLFNNFTLTYPYSQLQVGTSMLPSSCTAYMADGTTQNCLTTPSQTQGWAPTYQLLSPGNFTVNASTGQITATTVGSGSGVFATYNSGSAAGYPSVISGPSAGGTLTLSMSNSQAPDWEPSQFILEKPSGTPTATQFMNVLQWGASTMTPATATAVASTSGQAYDCALVGTVQACFMRTLATFTGTTFPASGATTIYVADLTPGASYNLAGTGVPAAATADNSGTLKFAATGTGNITVGTPIPSSISAVYGVGLFGVVIQ